MSAPAPVDRIGFIGLGVMGAAMAGNLRRAGHELVVYDLRSELVAELVSQGAVGAAGISELGAQCDVVFLSLPGPPEFSAVVTGPDGLGQSLSGGSLIVDLSTNDPEVVRAAFAGLDAAQIQLLDAPVSGGLPGAVAGTLALMVGGDPASFARVRGLLEVIGGDVVHVGDLGAGGVCKLVHNMIAGVLRMGIAEGFTLGVKAGVDVDKLWHCVNSGAVGQGLQIKRSLPERVFTGTFEPASFAAALSLKDIALATGLARSLGVPTPTADLARDAMAEVVARGWGQLDSWATFLLQEEAAGVRVRRDGAD